MSAYLVESKTINRVASVIFRNSLGQFAYTIEKLNELEIKNPAQLGEAMFNLNIEALIARYGSAEGFLKTDYNYQIEYPDNYQALKSLKCWIYQCSEGDIPDNSKLFKVMESVIITLAMSIIDIAPEYERAEWA